MSNLIITISREFGSGGRKIGELLATQLGIPFYDKEIIQMTAEKSGLSADFVASQEERSSRSFLFSIASSPYSGIASPFPYDNNVSDQAYFSQTDIIRELAKAGSCVIVGRCADFVLKGESIDVFIAASMPFKIARKRSMAPEKADYTDQQMAKWIDEVNKARCKYYEHYTNQKWGNIQNYHLCVHSDLVGVDGSVDTIMAYLNAIQ